MSRAFSCTMRSNKFVYNQNNVKQRLLVGTFSFTKHLNIHYSEMKGDINAFELDLLQNFVKLAKKQTAESVFIHDSKAEYLLNIRVYFE